MAMQVLDRTISVYAAVGMKLEQDAGLLIVGYGGDPIKWGERFVDIYGIEDGATLSVRKNEDAIHALEEVLQLGMTLRSGSSRSYAQVGARHFAALRQQRVVLPAPIQRPLDR